MSSRNLAASQPHSDHDRQEIVLATLRPLVGAIAGMLGPDCEVVLHDLRTPEQSIIAIANEHVTGRTLGGPVVGGPLNDIALEWLHQPGEDGQMRLYETRTRDGRALKSISIIYRDDGIPVGNVTAYVTLLRTIVTQRFTPFSRHF